MKADSLVYGFSLPDSTKLSRSSFSTSDYLEIHSLDTD